ncbi:MAG: hypothetical protein M3Q15_06290 [Pseudomonadota bacterium]|nr:hypothetical protein [Pseudomonadota bacterium]
MIIDEERRLPKVGLPTLAYIIAVLGALAVAVAFSPRGIWLALTVAVPVLALAWMLRQCVRNRRMSGPASPAQRAYIRRFIPLMLGYVLLLFAAVWLNRTMEPTGILAVALAVLPALPLIGVIWAMGRLVVEEKDEYQRSLTVRQFMIATGFMLAVTSIWGFLEGSGQVPDLPMYWAFIIWCAGLGVGSVVNEMRP